MERGKEKPGVEERGRSGERILVDSKEEGWDGMGQERRIKEGEKDKNKN